MADYILNVADETAKMDWAYSFQRTGAFPLDRSSLFSSYEDALLYAQKGEDSRGLSGTSYVGQTLSVYNSKNNNVTLYIINPDRTLKEVGSTPVGDNLSIEIVDNVLQLKNFGKGYYKYIAATKDEDGKIITPSSYEYVDNDFINGLEPKVILNSNNKLEIAWYEPSQETIDGVNAKVDTVIQSLENFDEILSGDNGLVKQFNNLNTTVGQSSNNGQPATGLFKEIENLNSIKADVNNVYTKEATDKAIAKAVSESNHLMRKVVNALAEIDLSADDALHYIYMVPTGLQYDDDKYDEYIVIEVNEVDEDTGENIVLKRIEKVGSWEVNLSDYATKTELNNGLALKVNAEENARLIYNTELEKLFNIEDNAQVNYINKVSNDFTVDSDKQLNLNNLPISKITNLEDELNKKVNAKEGFTLLSPDDQSKLAALVIDNGNLEISGSVNADNVKGLEDWLNKKASTTVGLSENNLTDELYEKLLNSLFIDSTSDEFTVNNHKLEVASIGQDKIIGLEEALKIKANQTEFNTLKNQVSGIEDDLNNYVLKADYEADIEEIRDILTWKDI